MPEDPIVIPRWALDKLLRKYRRALRAEGLTTDNCETLMTLLLNEIDERGVGVRRLAEKLGTSKSTAWRRAKEMDDEVSELKALRETILGQNWDSCGTESGDSGESEHIRETGMKREWNADETPPPFPDGSFSPTPPLSPLPNPKEKGVLRTPKKKGWTDDEIEGIYQCYPRKVGKRNALQAIPRALRRIRDSDDPPDDPVEWLKERVRKFAKSPAGNRGSYTPHPATWFNADRFDDADEEWYRDDEGSNGGGNGKSTQAEGSGRHALRKRAEGVGKYDGYLEG